MLTINSALTLFTWQLNMMLCTSGNDEVPAVANGTDASTISSRYVALSAGMSSAVASSDIDTNFVTDRSEYLVPHGLAHKSRTTFNNNKRYMREAGLL